MIFTIFLVGLSVVVVGDAIRRVAASARDDRKRDRRRG